MDACLDPEFMGADWELVLGYVKSLGSWEPATTYCHGICMGL